MKRNSGLKIIVSFLMVLIITLVFFISQQDLRAQKKKWTVQAHDKTNFPLIGKHRTVPCGDCHLNGVMQGTPTSCEACHWYRKKDDRYQLQLGIHCGDCHTPFDWKKIRPNSWNHEQASGFPLQGTHRILDCGNCHKNNILIGGPDDCFSCHQDDYKKAKNPDHVKANFSTDCKLCHSCFSWKISDYPHQSFILKGNHKTTDCSSCHKNGLYTGTPSDCVACHLDDYNATTDPNHKQSGFSTECQICHGDNALTWEGAVFNHDLVFPLLGAHRNLDCSECHASGTNPPQNCYGCHKADYEAAQNPNHRASGYPTNCESCHLPSHVSWSQAVFNHQFPINSGVHAGYDCSECHTTANYNQFSCLGCHAHNKNRMDSQHRNVSGYSYNSQACYSCHPRGQE